MVALDDPVFWSQRLGILWDAVGQPTFRVGKDKDEFIPGASASRAVLSAFRMTKPFEPCDRDPAALVLSPPEWMLDDAAPIVWC